jgi:hypothetical protein
MFEGSILQVGETSAIANVNRSRTNFGYDEEPVIVITRNGKPVYIHTLEGAQAELGDYGIATLNDAMAALLTKLNTPPET